jgi:DNA-binding winged helix-turn-helix (wHTH) protein
MPLPPPRYYDFGPYRLDWAKKILLNDRVPVDVTGKALDVLHYLIVNREQTVSKNDLLEALWPDIFVEEGNLSVHINALRNALGGESRDHYIKTIYGKGFTFNQDVTVSSERSDSFANPVICVVPAAFLAAISSFFFKLAPGFFGWSLVQASASAGMGAFQGATAGIIWAGSIVLGVSVVDFIRAKPRRALVVSAELSEVNFNRQWWTIVVGGISGLLSGGLIVLIVTSVFELDSLVKIGWMDAQIPRFSAQFVENVFVDTRMGWAYIIQGFFLGIGMSFTRASLIASARWADFVLNQREVTKLRDAVAIAVGAARILAAYCWPIIIFQMIAAIFVILIAEPGSGANELRSGMFGLLTGLAGDCSTQVVGAYFGLTGMAFGLVIARWGIRLDVHVE